MCGYSVVSACAIHNSVCYYRTLCGIAQLCVLLHNSVCCCTIPYFIDPRLKPAMNSPASFVVHLCHVTLPRPLSVLQTASMFYRFGGRDYLLNLIDTPVSLMVM